MSTLNVINLKHPSYAGNNVVLNNSGHITVNQVGLLGYLDSVPTLTTESSILGSDQSFRIKTSGGDVSHLYVQATTGKIGIGTSSPSQLLHLYSSSAVDIRALLEVSSTGKSPQLQFKTAAGETHTIGSETSSGNGAFGGSSGYALCLYAGGTTRPVQIGTNGSVRMTIDSSGNVGIGTDPSYLLHIGKDAAGGSATLRIQNFNTTTLSRSTLDFMTVNGNWDFSAYRDGYFSITSADAVERIRITNAGKTTIGPDLISNPTGDLNIIRNTNIKTEFYMQQYNQIEGHIGFVAPSDGKWYFGTGPSLGTYGLYQQNNGTTWTSVSDERLKEIKLEANEQ